ncbi:unnamed protein product [Leptidea sinapis]|uniref:G-protein coupled receptors family 3 profile domain-containing protein n=1 Tax=Leptidea sinapis TaxID=189913 RepID=A0A5E4R5B1_9NEOP|nr:unnamed protein product [Leptidea sinapis]
MAQGGVQALEAMLFALDEARRLHIPPPGVKLGALVLDDCDSSISNIDDEEYACNASALRKVISGVVGAASSVTSIFIKSKLWLKLSKYWAGDMSLSFTKNQIMALRNDICIAVKERLTKDSGASDEKGYDDIVERLLSRPRARGVIVFGSDQEVAGVMAAVQRRGAESTFGWVGSDGWSARALVAAGNEPVVEGTISVQPQANPVRGFRDYFLGLTPQNNPRNPWFVEFWEEQFRCRYPGAPRTPFNVDYKACGGEEKLSVDNTEFEAQLQFVADAVWSFVHAIRDMHRDLCGGKAGLCDAMRPVNGLSGDEFRFDQHGDGPARYNILHFKQVSLGVYRWLKVGMYLDGELQLDMKGQFNLVVIVWIIHGSTPVVRASGRELSFVLLIGILMCYMVTFALVLRPTNFLCSLQRFVTGFCFTVVYAALLTKTNRISRIFDASKFSARRPSFISPKSQMLICSILISIQVVIVIIWQLASPARAIHHYPSREDNMLVCDSYVDASYTIAFFYPVVLIVVCTVYAVLTRKIPEAFNESKHIGFTMYTTCVIWLAFVPLYFGTASYVPLRVTSMAITISLSASVTLACLFAPKVYIIIARPERNVRAHMMTSKWRNKHGRGTAPGAVCAALVGAATLPAATPSTDISTLDVTGALPSALPDVPLFHFLHRLSL